MPFIAAEHALPYITARLSQGGIHETSGVPHSSTMPQGADWMMAQKNCQNWTPSLGIVPPCALLYGRTCK